MRNLIPHTTIIFDIDGVIRDVSGSYRRALADTVEHFTDQAYRPTSTEIDTLKSEGIWNNDWEASQELIYRFYESQNLNRDSLNLDYQNIINFFQQRYRGRDPQNWDGYICDEPLLLKPQYLESLTAAGIAWGFFSGATRASASFVLERRLGLESPILIAMEDAPGKPNPTGLFATLKHLQPQPEASSPVFYVGDTVADMYTVVKAKTIYPQRQWIAVGILPPHVQKTATRREKYATSLLDAGADMVFCNVEDLTANRILTFIQTYA